MYSKCSRNLFKNQETHLMRPLAKAKGRNHVLLIDIFAGIKRKTHGNGRKWGLYEMRFYLWITMHTALREQADVRALKHYNIGIL